MTTPPPPDIVLPPPESPVSKRIRRDIPSQPTEEDDAELNNVQEDIEEVPEEVERGRVSYSFCLL